MGNTESASHGTGAASALNAASAELFESLPSADMDSHYLRACMDEMFDKDLIRKNYVTTLNAAQAMREDPDAGNNSPQSPTSASVEEAEAIADAVACLAYPYDAVARDLTVQRLTKGLTDNCREEDPFTTTLDQRVHFLRCMHAAMMRAWPHRAAIKAKTLQQEKMASVDRKAALIRSVLLDMSEAEHHKDTTPSIADADDDLTRRRRRRRRNRKTLSATANSGFFEDPQALVSTVSQESNRLKSTEAPGSFELSHPIRLGLNLFFTLLDCIQQDEACSVEQYVQLVREILPIAQTLEYELIDDSSSFYPASPLEVDRSQQQQQQQQQKPAIQNFGLSSPTSPTGAMPSASARKDASNSDVIKLQTGPGCEGPSRKMNDLPPIGMLNELSDFLYRTAMARKLVGPGTSRSLLDEDLLLGSARTGTLGSARPSSAGKNQRNESGGRDRIEEAQQQQIEKQQQQHSQQYQHHAEDNQQEARFMPASYQDLPLSTEERAQAVESLFTLALGRAKLVDFLLCLKVLVEDASINRPSGHMQVTASANLSVRTAGHDPSGRHDIVTPSTSPTEGFLSPAPIPHANNSDHKERSPEPFAPPSRMVKRGWRTVEDVMNGIDANDTDCKSPVTASLGESVTADGEGPSVVANVLVPDASIADLRDANSVDAEAVFAGATVAEMSSKSRMMPVAGRPWPGDVVGGNNNFEDTAAPSKGGNNNNDADELRSPRERRIREQARRSFLKGKQDALRPLDLWTKLMQLSDIDTRKLFQAHMLGAKTEDVQVWSFGQNSYGELAHGDTITRKAAKQASVLNSKDVIQVAAGNEHTIVLTRSGKVYAVGYNDNGQCGQGNTGRVAHLSNIEALNNKNVVQVHAYNGCEHTLCVTQEGALYSFGYNYRGQLGHGNTTSISAPQLVPGFGIPGRRVRHVSCSYYHSVVATDSGEVYSFGRNDFGQLGLGDTLDRKEPTRVEALSSGEHVASVACGQYHTVVALSSGTVYACGKNDYGQLGLKLAEPHRRMTIVRAFGSKGIDRESDDCIKELRCGYYHTIALSTTGKLWAFGRNDYGQLGIGSTSQKVFGPREVEDLDGVTARIVRIAAGCYHTVAVDQNNVMYVFGRNNHGQLGCGDSPERPSPLPLKSFAGSRIADVAAGFYHTIVLVGGQEVDEKDPIDKEESFLFAPEQNDLRSFVTQEREAVSLRRKLLSPLELAFHTLYNLDRLGSYHSHRQDQVQRWRGQRAYPALDPLAEMEGAKAAFPGNAGTRADGADGDVTTPANVQQSLPPADLPFCIDSDPRTLVLLVYIARLCTKQAQKMQSNPGNERWTYMILALLRLTKNNLAQLLWSGAGPRLQREMQDLESEPSAIVRALDEVHRFALDTIENPPSLRTRQDSEMAQSIASEILMTGLELFYPTQELQVQLLASLMAENDENDEREEETKGGEDIFIKTPELRKQLAARDHGSTSQSAADFAAQTRISPRSPLFKFQQTSSPAVFSKGLKRYLLEPLLRRLADDELVSAMVPYQTSLLSNDVETSSLSSHQRLRSHLSKVEDETSEASVALLSSLLSSLVRQIGVETGRAISLGLRNPANTNGFLQLLLSLQKHLLSWAANSTHPTEDGADGLERTSLFLDELLEKSYEINILSPNSAGTASSAPHPEVLPSSGSLGNLSNNSASSRSLEHGEHEGVSGLDESTTFPWAQETSNSTAWDCLMRYAELVLRQSNDELAAVNSSESIDALTQKSVVARVLPSLVMGLSLFADRTYFARRLLPRVIDTLHAVDEVAQRAPQLTQADQDYRMASEQFGGTRIKSRKKRIEEALALASLPWLLQLEKALASLGGKLASTLVNGQVEGEARQLERVPGPDDVRESYVVWRDSPLFKGGLDGRVISRTCSQSKNGLLAMLQLSGDDKPIDFTRPLSASSKRAAQSQKLDPSWFKMFSFAEQWRFLQRIQRGEEPVVETMRATHAKTNFAYNVTLIQGRGNGGADASALEKVEACIFAAVLKHTGAILDAILFSQNLEAGLPPPPRIWDCWRAAADVRMHLVRLRSQFMASASDDSSESEDHTLFQAFCTGYLKRAQFLLLFGSASAAKQVRSAHTGAKTENQHWKVLRAAVWTAIRWKRVTKEGIQCKAALTSTASDNGMVHMVVRFIKCPTDMTVTVDPNAPPTSPTKKPTSPSKRRKQLMQQQFFSLSSLFWMIINNCRRAFLRTSGLDSFRQLLSTPKLVSPRADILRHLAPSLRMPSDLATVMLSGKDRQGSQSQHSDGSSKSSKKTIEPIGHYGTGLSAAGPSAMSAVHSAFLKLYTDLAYSLKSALSENGRACAQERLLLLDAWATPLGPIDADLLCSTGLLKTLQSALQMDREMDQQGEDEKQGFQRPSKDGTKSAERKRKKQIGRAAWMLFRLLLAQIGEDGDSDGRLASLLDVLYMEMQASLKMMLPHRDDVENDAHVKSGSKNSYDLVTIPTRVNSVGGGLVVSPPSIQDQTRSGVDSATDDEDSEEFSISFWVFPERQVSGLDRVLMMRGNANMQLPILTIRDVDNRLELWSSISDDESERVVSKDPLPLNAWTHIAVVMEQGKLRLFVNGDLDGQQQIPLSLTMSQEPASSKNLPISIGKPNLDRMLSGFEGYVAQLKFRTRALSPIHVHVMFDQGPPKHFRVLDRHCYQLVVLQQTLTESGLGRKSLVMPRWLQLHASLIMYGTPRVQQAILRLWRVLFPQTHPDDVAPHILTPLIQAREGVRYTGKDFVDFLLAQIGVGVWHSKESPTPPASAQTPMSTTSECNELILNEEPTTPTRRSIKARAPTQVSASGAPRTPVDAKRKHKKLNLECDTSVARWRRRDVEVKPTVMSKSSTQNSFALSSELIMLVRLLSANPTWAGMLSSRMQDAMADMSTHLFSPKRSKVVQGANPFEFESNSVHALRSVGTLAVLGGHNESLRIGGRVAMTHADITATVVSLDESASNSALVVMTPKRANLEQLLEEEEEQEALEDPKEAQLHQQQLHAQQQLLQHTEASTGAEDRVMKAVRMNSEELVPIPEFGSPFANLSPRRRKKPAADEVEVEPTLEDSFYRLLRHLFVVQLDTTTRSKTVLLAQCRARTLRVLLELLQTHDCDFEELFERTQDQGENIATSLLQLAVRSLKDKRFVTLEGMEVRAEELRKRLHTLRNATHGSNTSASRSHTNDQEDESPASSTPKHTPIAPRVETHVHVDGDDEVAVLMYSDDDEDEDDEDEDDDADDDDNSGGAEVHPMHSFDAETGEHLVNFTNGASQNSMPMRNSFHDEDLGLSSSDEEDDDGEIDGDEEDEDEDAEEDHGDEGQTTTMDVDMNHANENSVDDTNDVNGEPPSSSNDPPAYLVDELVAMGFPEEWCVVALRLQGYDLIAASTWIVDNLDMLSSTPLSELLPPSLMESKTYDDEEVSASMSTEQLGNLNRDSRVSMDEMPLVEPLQERNVQAAPGANIKIDEEKRRGRRRLQRAKASLRRVEVPFQQLEVTFGDNVFADDFFRTDACASYGYGYRCGALGLYNGLHAEGGKLDAARDAFRSEIALLGFADLEKLCTELEEELSILYARSCLLILLQRWREWPSHTVDFEKVFHEESLHFAKFLRLVIFRGPQIMPTLLDEFSDGNLPGMVPIAPPRPGSLAELESYLPRMGNGTQDDLLPAEVGSIDPRVASNNANQNDRKNRKGVNSVAAAAGSVLRLSLEAIRPCLLQLLRKDQNSGKLGAALADFVLDDLDNAARSEEHVEALWGMRELTSSDFQVSREPCVEFDAWLLGILQYEGVGEVLDENAFTRYASLLSSPNMPLKCVALKSLVKVLRREPQFAAQLPYRRLFSICQQRANLEAQGQRVFYSKFLAAGVELLTLMRESLAPSQLALANVEIFELAERTYKGAMLPHKCRGVSSLVDAKCVCCSETQGGIKCAECEALFCEGCAQRHDASHMLLISPCCSEVVVDSKASQENDRPSSIGIRSFVVTSTDCESIEVAWHLEDNFDNEIVLQANEKVFCVTENNGSCFRFVGLRAGTTYQVSLSVMAKDGERTKFTTLKARTKDRLAFEFDPFNCGPNIRITEKGLCARFSATESWSTVLGTRGYSSGVHTWQVRVDESDSPYLFVGVASRKACLQTFLGGDEHGWGYIGDRALYHKRNRLSIYGDRFGQGDTLTVTLNMDVGNLSFARNGKDLGVAVEGLTGVLYPAFAFYSGSQVISLVKKSLYRKDITSDPAIPETVFTEETLTAACTIERFSNADYRVDADLEDDAYRCHEDWSEQKWARVWTRFGRDEVLLRPGKIEKVQSHLGTGTIVGYSPHDQTQAWIEYDEAHAQGAWPMSLDDDRLTILHESELPAPVIKLTMPREAFVEHLHSLDPHVARNVDEDLVAELGAYCERKGCNPFSISPDCFAEELFPAMQLRSRTRVKLDQLAARFALLKVLNERYEIVLPWFAAQMESKSDATILVEGELVNSVSALSSSTNGEEGGKLRLATLPQKLSYFRGIIFYHIKKQLLDRILDRSATVPKRAEDDYEYPEELPQLMLNRPKAAFSRTLPDAESRLSFSLFGQAFDELHFLEPKTLRIAYSHPMDEGQARTFKVKFEGEGVDDYGGPYREVFSQWSTELTATTLSPDGAAEEGVADQDLGDGTTGNNSGEGKEGGNTDEDAEDKKDNQQMQCVLPILHPCPNRQHGVGANREKYVLRPDPGQSSEARTLGRGKKDSGAHLLLEMVNFCGQLLGIAMRTKTLFNVDLANVVWKPLVGASLQVEDLRDVDHSTFSLVEQLRSADPAYLEAMCDELRWNTTLSDGTRVELVPGGHHLRVNASDVEDYIRALLRVRLREAQFTTAALRDGLASVIPRPALSLLTPEELERKICGAPELDVDLLRSCTEYDDDLSEDDPHIQSFWRVLHNFPNKQRQMFLRFVWARSRLPPTKHDFPQHLKIQAPVAEGPRENPDMWLPKAHTCFFALSLPKYSSDKIMEEKLRYAITNTTEMDADFNINQSENQHWQAPDSAEAAAGRASPVLRIQTSDN